MSTDDKYDDAYGWPRTEYIARLVEVLEEAGLARRSVVVIDSTADAAGTMIAAADAGVGSDAISTAIIPLSYQPNYYSPRPPQGQYRDQEISNLGFCWIGRLRRWKLKRRLDRSRVYRVPAAEGKVVPEAMLRRRMMPCNRRPSGEVLQ